METTLDWQKYARGVVVEPEHLLSEAAQGEFVPREDVQESLRARWKREINRHTQRLFNLHEGDPRLRCELGVDEA